MATIACVVKVESPLCLIQPVPCILFANAAVPLLVAVSRGTKEELKGNVPHHVTLTLTLVLRFFTLLH